MILFKENICSGLKEKQCAYDLVIDTTSCLTSCSGLVLTSFFKSETKYDLESLMPDEFTAYNKYTKWSPFYTGLEGRFDL